MKRFFQGLSSAILAAVLLLTPASALTVEQAIELLEAEYLRELPAQAYEAEDVNSLMDLLGDPYSYYMSREEYEGFLSSVENTVSLVGIGVSIQYTDEGIYVLEPLKGGSAYEAGIQTGDLIVAVDGVSCVPAREEDRNLIVGEKGTTVSVTVLRDGITYEYELVRYPVIIPNTQFDVMDDHVGYIECSSFGSDTGRLFLDGIQTYNEEVDCWLVDLRSNSGGYSNAAVEALGALAGAGLHLYLEDAAGNVYYYAYEAEASTKHPVVVLVDEYTASASEAFVAGVRDLGLGMTVGTRTYGKGTAQIVRDSQTDPVYFNGDALKLTAYRFYSNGAVTNDRVGVIPTLLVPNEAAYDVAIALCGGTSGNLEDQFLLEVGGCLAAIDLTATTKETLSVIFEALPPTADLWFYEDGAILEHTVENAAEWLGVDYQSRWFADVTDNDYADSINTLATYGLLHGDGNGNFYPKSELTRAEACGLIGKALGLNGSGVSWFADVTDETPCAVYINALAEIGMVDGTGDGLFCPDQTLTRQEFYTLLARALQYLNLDRKLAAGEIMQEYMVKIASLGFAEWADDSVALLEVAGVTTVDESAVPAGTMLREEAAANMYSMLLSAGVLK